ncbi:MAG: class I SAM-dependent methyltransferase [Myxococcales bacterium]|nr:class I SAM-dependent methyltransferase [Myxococcales bacterium]MCB9550522.1 class I SAM-dependent methyltransferase [Myxococcales bacterium]
MTHDDALRRLTAAGLPTDALDAAAFARVERFFEARARWAKTHNLSGPRALADPWAVDLADGVAVAVCVPPAARLVDVGAGSGVPGVVVACLDPARAVVLVEPIAKRTAFLRSVLPALGLPRVEVVRDRWPVTLAGPVEVVSRAVVDPADWPALAVAGGEAVTGVVRMLAARRPAWTVSGFVEGEAIDYALGADGARRVERWRRA